MAASRISKVNSFLKRELAALLEQNIQDDKTGLITITKVDCSADMKSAKIWVSILGGQISPISVIKKIKGRRKLIQYELWKKMHARNIPNLEFRLDENAEYVQHIEEILNSLK